MKLSHFQRMGLAVLLENNKKQPTCLQMQFGLDSTQPKRLPAERKRKHRQNTKKRRPACLTDLNKTPIFFNTNRTSTPSGCRPSRILSLQHIVRMPLASTCFLPACCLPLAVCACAAIVVDARDVAYGKPLLSACVVPLRAFGGV